MILGTSALWLPDECTGSVPNFKIVVIITDLCEMPNISN